MFDGSTHGEEVLYHRPDVGKDPVACGQFERWARSQKFGVGIAVLGAKTSPSVVAVPAEE